MDGYYNYHDKDVVIVEKDTLSNEEYCICPSDSETEWVPFMSFPLTKRCNFHCEYCGVGGEATGSQEQAFSLAMIKHFVSIAQEHGIIKFRLTGGEPFLNPQIGEILHFFSEKGVFTLVNTNGSLIMQNENLLRSINQNIKFAVSLDTLDQEKFRSISKQDMMQRVIDGIDLLSSLGLLFRCNMVVSKRNIDEIIPMIHFCQERKCDLKLLDIVSVPVPYGERKSIYQEITSVENVLLQSCDEVFSHEYTRNFGTPCYRYRFGDTFVTVKNSQKGSHYDYNKEGICMGCTYFPCHEGLYDIFALSDGKLCACRWTEKQAYSNVDKQLEYLIRAFKRSRYVAKSDNSDMKAREDLQCDE